MTHKNKLIFFCILGIIIIFGVTLNKNIKKNILTDSSINESPQAIVYAVDETALKIKATSTKAFIKPPLSNLRKTLTPIQYSVTQEDGTEPAFNNLYVHNTEAGIYVDIVSGEPLFSSKDKYDSGTGWPSFVKPISQSAVVEKVDKVLLVTRTEIRSPIADSHLGHVFEDGPQDRGGKRYCMNSAALRFIPKRDMEKLGYGEYITFVK